MAKRGLKEARPRLGTVVGRFRKDMRGQAPLIAAGLVTMLLEVVFRLAQPWPLKLVLDGVIQTGPNQASTGYEFFDQMEATTLLWVAAAGVLLVAAFRAATAYASTVSFALAGNRILTKLRTRLYHHLQRLDLDFHHSSRGGDLITRLTGDVGRLQEVTVTAA